jgi:pantoate kinase
VQQGSYCLEAEAPLHVTGLWLPFWRPSLLESGSLGAGLLLEPTVRIRVEPCGRGRRCGVSVYTPDGLLGGVPSVAVEVYRLHPAASRMSVRVESPVGIGLGYAVSAAVALGAALAATAGGGLAGVEEAARLAHMAEVAAGTGLGDVVALLYGRGLELRLAPGGPGLARVDSVPIDYEAVSVALGGPEETSAMHRQLSWRLHSLAAPRLARLFEKPGLEVFLEEARGFSLEAGFVTGEQAKVLDRLVEEGLALGWYAKKRVAVVVAARRGYAGELAERLREAGYRPVVHRAALSPLRVSTSPCGEGRGDASR